MAIDGGAGSVSFLNEYRNELEITRNDEQMILARCGGSVRVATCHAVSFRRDGVSSAGTPLKTPWHGLLRALVQEWTNMNCTVASANNFSGQ
jgi:hypothetical protein